MSTSTTPTAHDIRDAIDSYLHDWDRSQWQQDHGEWASTRWDDEREAYTAAVERLRSALAAAEPLPTATEEQTADYEAAVEDLLETLVAADRMDDPYAVSAAAKTVIAAAPAAIAGAESVTAAMDAVQTAAWDLDGQVRPDESDYIAMGTIDPDDVSAEAVDLEIGDRWQGWDCTEGWAAYRHRDALYVRWYRDACGNRHSRDLWVRVDAEFFSATE